MAKIKFRFLDGHFYSLGMKRWARAAREASTAPLAILRRQTKRARLMRAHLDKLIHTAEERLALPAIGSTNFPKPHNADWAWRPGLWRGPLPKPGMSSVQTQSKLSDEVTLFHDCGELEITLRQLRNLREEDLAPYGLRLDVFNFSGSFLSLAVGLPSAATDGLTRRHVIHVDAIIEMENPLELFARLNVQNGPNTEQLVNEVRVENNRFVVEFDLAYSNINEKRVEKGWIDIIFEGPQMNQVTLRDLTFARKARAAI